MQALGQAVMAVALTLHIAGGSVAILSGFAAALVRKGDPRHQLLGNVFFVAMLVMAGMGAAMAIVLSQKSNIAGGVFAIYLVTSAWITVRRKDGRIGPMEYLGLALGLLAVAVTTTFGIQAYANPEQPTGGSPPAALFAFAGVAAVASALDLKVILRGGISGVARMRRHIWRICLALFFATGSFFLGQQRVMPVFMQGSPLLFVPALAPLPIMLYWLVRVRRPGWFTRYRTPLPAGRNALADRQ